ncbi:hypothetical protein HC928_10725 [bacterium]|nr:hypothetical protein [bacterium]
MNTELHYQLNRLHRQTLEQQARQHQLAAETLQNAEAAPAYSAVMRAFTVLVVALAVVLGAGIGQAAFGTNRLPELQFRGSTLP